MVSPRKDPLIFGSIIAGAFACFLATVSLFLPGWRIGAGSKELFLGSWKWARTLGSRTRQFGLIQVRGTYSQTVGTLATQTCSHVWVQLLNKSVDQLVGQDCIEAGGAQCNYGFDVMVNDRCTYYQLLQVTSYICLGCTFMAVIMLIGATLVAFLTKISVTGYLVTGLYLFAFVALVATNVLYVVISNHVFHKLRESQTYPYPSLYYAYYLHLTAVIMLGGVLLLFYWKVLPRARSYDPEEEKRKKKEKRYGWIVRRRQQQQQQQHFEAMQQQCSSAPLPCSYGQSLYPSAPAPHFYPSSGPPSVAPPGRSFPPPIESKPGSLPPRPPSWPPRTATPDPIQSGYSMGGPGSFPSPGGYPVSGPPRSFPSHGGYPVSGPPGSFPPQSGYPVSGPPGSFPPHSGYPRSGPPGSFPPHSGYPKSGPPGFFPPQ